MFLINSKGEKILFNTKDTYTWYNCGPTIYNRSHLGHARTFTTIDFIIRYLRLNNIKINFGMNITDIDDKIINKILAINSDNKMRTYYEFIHEYYSYFINDLELMKVKNPDVILKVSEVIPHIITFIQSIIDDNFAYISNGSVYFDSIKYDEVYGKCFLDRSTSDDIVTKTEHASEKKSSKDFALWKAEKSEHDIAFESPWGFGRPGWSIECSVMASIMFGDNVSIHSGGIDLAFPHHHNEVLQSTVYYKKNIFDNFLHIGHLYINSEKMSQSLGNTVLIKDFIDKYGSNVLRIVFMFSDYHSNFDLNDDVIQQAVSLNTRIKEFISSLLLNEKNIHGISHDDTSKKIEELRLKINNHLANNFDTRSLILELGHAINDINKSISNNELSSCDSTEYLKFFRQLFEVMGLDYEFNNDYVKYIDSIVNIRSDLRSIVMKNPETDIKKLVFALSDKIRDVILPNLGYKVDDIKNPSGELIYKVKKI